MGLTLRGGMVAGEMPLAELKLVYRALHHGLARFPELIETDFLHSLQTLLHQQAVRDGIDATDHGQWDAWLADIAVQPGDFERK